VGAAVPVRVPALARVARVPVLAAVDDLPLINIAPGVINEHTRSIPIQL
jgi:hypothetical protein